ncbi:response regulator [Winogradskyella forsetii]|uniref:response regulator n=1 Tax=Winogradskyella forsetii TaxID=2686077 RepID=UPI0015C02695|nr:response regulator [Winogradskyella forsetii]
MKKDIKYEEPITVLVVENNDGDFVLVEDYLFEKFKSIKVKRSQDFKETASVIEKNKASLSVILLDLHLHDGSGLELIKKVLTAANDIPILILTGYSDVSIAQLSLQLGVYDFLVKDELNPNLLHKSIDFAMNRRQFICQIESERLNYENLFNFSPQPMWLLDHDNFKILNANYSAIKNYGYSLKEYQDMSFMTLHPKEEQEHVSKWLSDDTHTAKNDNFIHLLKDGTQIKVDVHSEEVKSASNEKMTIVQSNDITETLNHIETIEIQNNSLREIAWTQSHVVRAPLSRILGIIDLIETHKDNIEDLSFWLNELKNSSNEMDTIVKEIVNKSQNFNLTNQDE